MDGTVLPQGLDDMVDRLTLPKGELSRRLAALGWSLRGYAAEIGEDEGSLRRWDAGVAGARVDVLAWLEREEKHRAKNPPPVKLGGKAAGGSPKQRRRPPGVKAEAPGPSEKVEAVPAYTSSEAAAEADDLQLLASVFRVPDVQLLAPLFPRPAEQSDNERVKLILDWLGWSPRELADRMGAPKADRDIRRWAKGQRPVKPEVMEWFEELAKAVARRPAGITVWHRQLLEHLRLRGEVERRMNEATARIEDMRPAGDEQWEDILDRAAMMRPAWLAGTQEEVVDPKRPVRLDEIL